MCRKPVCLVLGVLVIGLIGTASGDLVGHWTLDEGSGTTAYDSSGHGNDGTIMDNPALADPTWIPGVFGSALEFHGLGVVGTGGDYIDCGNDASLDIGGPISITLWIRPDADDPEGKGTSGGETAPMAKALDPSWSWQIRYGWGSPQPYMSFTFNTSPRAWAYVGENLERYEWYHIACSHDGTTLKCFLNGEETDSTPMGQIASSDTPVLIGSDGWACDWTGAIDDVRIYDHALTAQQIRAMVPPKVKARKPDPADGATGVTTPLLQWTPGDTAISHNMYFGTNPTPGEAEFIGPLGWTVYWHTPGIDAGTTYYWRIDEVEPNGTIHAGDVWSFTTAPATAHNPSPCDGMKWIDPDAALSWSIGLNATSHDVYFGTDETAVANADPSVLVQSSGAPSYDPVGLAQETTYYWRVDEQTPTGVHEGAVWSFTTAGPLPPNAGLKGLYFNNMNMSGAPSLVRIDPEVDFNWGDPGGPGTPIGVDQFSARWIGEIDIPSSTTYTFSTNTDDGVRLWVGGQLVVDAWVDQSPTVRTSDPIELAAGRYTIQMEYYENTGGAVCQLYWESRCMAREIIPQVALSPPMRASGPSPSNGATGVSDTPTLEWIPGEEAAHHDVYFGDNEIAVADADTTTTGVYRGRQTSTKYVPPEAPLEWDKTYYWRIDEVNGVDMWPGNVWSFTVANYIIVDDFEDYNDYTPDRIFQTWIDGFGYTEPPPGKTGNGTGSTVGHLAPPFAEQTTVHGGRQSMPFGYDNTGMGGKARYSEAEREYAVAQNFSRKGVKSMSLWVYGDPCNVPAAVYVGLQDSAGTRVDFPETNANLVAMSGWHEINIEISKLSPVNLNSIRKIYLGVGNRLSPVPGPTGDLFIDDIRLYAPRCVPSEIKPANDLNDDCIVDYLDLEIVVNEWLTSGHLVTPVDPGTAGLIAYYALDGNTNDTVGGHNGTPNGGPTYGPGHVGQAIRLDGTNDYVVAGPVGLSGADARTITCWAKADSTAIADWTNIFGFVGPDVDPRTDMSFDFEIVGATGTTTAGWFGIHVYGWEHDIVANDLDWHHLAASYDGTTVRAYGDGVLTGTGSRNLATTDTIHMGKRSDYENYFPGSVDEARIFDRALSDAEIAYLAGVTVPFSAAFDLNADDTVDFLDVGVLGGTWLEELLWPAGP